MGKISTSLALVVKKESIGEIETNIADIEQFVVERIKDYAPDTYMGDADSAKKDRAELNKAKKTLSDTRKAVIDRFLEPVRDFESRCKKLETLLDDASGKLDEIVKTKEGEEKEAKRSLIQTEWNSRNFDLVPLEKVFNQKWLNKTYKLTDIRDEITASIEKIYKDLKTIEQYSDDAETLKAHYLMCLDIGDTLDYGEELKKQKEVAKKEEEGRAEREHIERIAEQSMEVAKEYEENKKHEKMSSLVAQAIEEEIVEPTAEYTITVNVTAKQLNDIKHWLTLSDIEYECHKLEF